MREAVPEFFDFFWRVDLTGYTEQWHLILPTSYGKSFHNGIELRSRILRQASTKIKSKQTSPPAGSDPAPLLTGFARFQAHIAHHMRWIGGGNRPPGCKPGMRDVLVLDPVHQSVVKPLSVPDPDHSDEIISILLQ